MKIIASDYDGTLNHGGIDDAKRAAIAAWRAKGNLFGLVSGRGVESLAELSEQDGISYDFLLACNGAAICTPEGKILRDCRCDGHLAKPLLSQMVSLGATECYVESTFVFGVFEPLESDHPKHFSLKTMPDIPYFLQISTILPTNDDAARITAAIRERFGDDLNPLQNGRCIDIVHKTMNKAQGIYGLLDIFGAKYEDVIAVGDNINDTDMIAEFRSYAMENAVPSIKALADAETPSITALIERELNA